MRMKTLLETRDPMGMKGMILLREHKAGTVDFLKPFLESYNKLKKLSLENEAYRDKKHLSVISSLYQYIQDTLDITTIGRLETPNLIMTAPNVGRDLVIQRLLGINTYSLNIAWGEIGTGTTTPALTDTALTTPVARASLTAGVSANVGNNTAQMQFFYPDSVLTNSVYAEFGCFVDGSNTLGSGQLFNHSLFASTYTKAAGTDITVQVQINLS
jgi:hypothetical protein